MSINILRRVTDERGSPVWQEPDQASLNRTKSIEQEAQEGDMVEQPAGQAPFEPEEERDMENGIFRKIVEGINDYVFVCTPDCRIRYMNQSLIKKLGRDATGEKCHKAIHGCEEVCAFCSDKVLPAGKSICREFASPANQLIYDVSNTMLEEEDGELRLTSKNGDKTPFPLRNSTFSVNDRRYVILSGNDLVERYEAEKVLHQLSRAVEQSPCSIVITDTGGTIEYVNEKFCQVTGYSLEEAIGRNWRELLAENGLDIPSSSESGREFCHDPSGRWFVFHSYPFTDRSSNEVTGAVITLHDNTVVKQFICELEKAYADLKNTHAKVVQQEKMASIGQLAAGMAHEINNPMGFISSNLGTLGKYLERLDGFIQAQWDLIEMVTDDGSTAGLREKRKALKIDYILEDGRELIKESQEGTERVRTIVQNLKSFSRVDEAECKHADINECILSTINIVWNELKYKTTLIKELGDIPLTRCHPQQINQVIMNLLVNAVHAIGKQGEITVRTWHENGSIFASVKDTGCGMTPEVVNRIFEPFFTTKEVGKGTGLGLSITYDIIKGHNGEITVDSETGKGTTFTVRLPVVEGK
jgi:PAS domain S-box-containing protein